MIIYGRRSPADTTKMAVVKILNSRLPRNCRCESKNIDFASNIKSEFKFKSRKALFEKTVFEIEFQNSVNFFAIESINSNDVIESDVNDH